MTTTEKLCYATVLLCLLFLLPQSRMTRDEMEKNMDETRVMLESQGEVMADVYAQHEEQAVVLDEILSKVDGLQTVIANITAYTLDPKETDSTPNQTATMDRPRAGRTCAVSPDLSSLLGKRVYVAGHGVRVVNDLTAVGITNTIDLLVGNKKQAKEIGRNVGKVVVL